MPTLREVEHSLVDALLRREDGAAVSYIVDDGIAGAERLAIHRGTLVGGLTAVLNGVFPAVERLVGAEFFAGAAACYIEESPPSCAWLDVYGDSFADFLTRFEPARGLAYLPDVARVEWAVARAANAPDRPALSPAGLAALSEAAQAALVLHPHPSWTLVETVWPADDIRRFVLDGDDEALAGLDMTPSRRWLAVHRDAHGTATLRRLDADWAAFVRRLLSGETLGGIITAETSPAHLKMFAQHLAAGCFVLGEN
jgi:hypothetical protein